MNTESDNKAGTILAFANQKGGVGKSTSVVNLAASLGLLGKKVLVVDSDPQGNTTSGFGVAKKDLTSSVYEMLIGQAEAASCVRSTRFQGISLIPAGISLAGAEFELILEERRETRLKEALLPIVPEYDFVLVDCPPSLGILTINALVAADSLVIPMQCEYYSLEGLTQLIYSIRQIKRRMNPSLTVAGILITMYNGRLNLSEQVMAELHKYYANKLFKTVISRNVTLSEAPSFGEPVWYYDRHSKGALQYMEVAKELLQRL